MKKQVKITLIKSLIGRLPKHITIAHQLGLKKINYAVIHNDTKEIRGLINKVNYLVKIEEFSS